MNTRPFPRSPVRPRAVAAAPAVAGHRPVVLAMAVAAAFSAMPARSQPAGATAIHGTVHLQQQGSTLVVNTTNGAGTAHSAINWQSFSIPAGSTTHFAQPNAASTSINRVVGPDPSAIFGTLSSNGRLVLVNPAGITVGAGAVVDTAGFTASTLRMGEADAIAGRLRFDGAGTGALRVDGQVLARSGDVVLIGSSVQTGAQALVESPQGATIVAAGQKVELTGRGLEGIFLEVQAPADQAVNLGTLRGDAVGIFAGTLRHSGLVQAQAVSTEGGKVVLKAADQAVVAGTVRAQGLGGAGGRVDVLGDKVGLVAGALVDTSNTAGGGQIRVGGDYQGRNAAVPNAQVTYVDRDATLRANATDRGDGGKVIVWADDTTRMFGTIEARGGNAGGDGGFVETSGKRYLDVEGSRVNAGAARGAAGTWLLDPSDIYIVSASAPAPAPVDLGSGPNFTSAANGNASTVTDATIRAALDGNTSVTLQTDAGSGSGSGNIYFGDGSVQSLDLRRSAAGSATLVLQAVNDIAFLAGSSTLFGTTGGAGRTLDVRLNAGNQVRTDAGAAVRFATDDNASSVKAIVGAGRTWANAGLLRLDLNAKLDLSSGATFQNNGSLLGAMGPGGGIAGGNLQSTSTVNLTQGDIAVDNLSVSGTGTFAFDGHSFSTTGIGYNGGALQLVTQSGDLHLNLSSQLVSSSSVQLKAMGGNVYLSQGVRATGPVQVQAAGSVVASNIDTSVSGGGTAGSIVVQAGNNLTLGLVNASGGSLGSGNGGAVSLTAGGDLALDAILSAGASGYSGSSLGSAGGNAGQVFAGAGGGVTFYGTYFNGEYVDIDASGGSGGLVTGSAGTAGAGGNGASVTLHVGGASSSLQHGVRASGGDGGRGLATFGSAVGGAGGAGGAVALALQPSSVLFLQGGLHASGGAGGTAVGATGANGASAGISTSGGTILVPTSTALPSTASSSGSTQASLNLDGTWSNTSTMVLNNGAWVRVNGDAVNTGTVHLGTGALLSLGKYDKATSIFSPGGGMTLVNAAGGFLQGSGNVQANVQNAGTIRPGGHGLGTLTITGDLQQQPTGMLEFDVGGGTPFVPGTTYDQLRVTGNLGLGGQALVQSLSASASTSAPATTPAAPTANYEVIDAGSVSGSGFTLISGSSTLLGQARMRVGGTLQNLPGGTASQLIAAIAQLLPGVSVATIQDVLTQSFNNAIAPEEPESGDRDDTRKTGDVIVTDASCKPS